MSRAVKLWNLSQDSSVLGGFALLGIVLAILQGGCAPTGAEPSEAPGASAARTTGLQVQRGTLTREILLTGELVAESADELVAPDAGVWPLSIRWLAENGQPIAAGERAVEFDNSSLASQLEERKAQEIQARNRLTTARAQAAAEVGEADFRLIQARAELQKAEIAASLPERLEAARDYQKKQLDLRKTELAVTDAERNLEAAREGAAASIEIERIAVEKAQLAVRRAQEGIGLLTLSAPRAGILVIQTDPQQGRTFQVGDNTWPGHAVARLPDLSTMAVKAALPDVDDGSITEGWAAEVTLDAYPERPFAGRVERINRIAQSAGRRSARRFFDVAIRLDEVDEERMRPGMSVKVKIAAPPLEEVLLVPRAALSFSGVSADGGQKVRVRLASGAWRPVRLGVCSVRACVLEEGSGEASDERLEEGQALAVAGEGQGESP